MPKRNPYRVLPDDRDEAVRLRRLMPTLAHIPELIAPVTAGCRKIVPALRAAPARRAIVYVTLPTGDKVPAVAEVDEDAGFTKAILWLAGGAIREFLRDATRQSRATLRPGQIASAALDRDHA